MTFRVQLKQIHTKLMQRGNSESLVWFPIATSVQMNYYREKFNKPDKTNCIAVTSKNKLVTPNSWIGQLHAHKNLQEAMEADNDSHERVQWPLLLQHLNTHLDIL